MQFHNVWCILPFGSSSQKFHQVTVVTFSLDSQNNSVFWESISMEATCLVFGVTVRAEAELLILLCFHEANISTPKCTYFPSAVSLVRSITSQDVVAVLCLSTTDIGFLWLGSHPQKLPLICSILVGPWHCNKMVSLIVPPRPFGGGGPIPSSSTSRANSSHSPNL